MLKRLARYIAKRKRMAAIYVTSLSDPPQFTIQKIEQTDTPTTIERTEAVFSYEYVPRSRYSSTKCVGTFTHLRGLSIKKGLNRIDIYKHPAVFIDGKFEVLNLRRKQAAFFPIEEDMEAHLEVGQTYYCFDGYWAMRAELVLDRSKTWVKIRFEPRDAIECRVDNMRVVTQPGAKVPEKVESPRIVKGGWDHEHCNICWATIDEFRNQYAYIDQEKHWLCEDCYNNYYVPQSLHFITIPKYDQPLKG